MKTFINRKTALIRQKKYLKQTNLVAIALDEQLQRSSESRFNDPILPN